MKLLLTIWLAVALCMTVHGQAPVVRNTFDTNAATGYSLVGTNLSVPGNLSANGGVFTNTLTLNGAAVLTNAPSGSGSANTIAKWSSASALANIANGAEGTVLGISNGVPAYINASGGSSTTNYYSTTVTTNSYSISNYFTVGKGGKITITNSIALGDYFIYPLQAGTGITFTTNANPTSGTNITIAASGGGGGSALYVNGTSVTNANLKDSGSITYTTSATTNISPGIAAQAFNLLSYSGGTNVTIDCSLGNAMEAHYYLTVTNTTFFPTPTSVPTTAKRFVVHLKNDSTGGYAVTFTNGTFSWSEGVVPLKTTNANYADVFEFVTSPFTNTDLIGTMVQNVHR